MHQPFVVGRGEPKAVNPRRFLGQSAIEQVLPRFDSRALSKKRVLEYFLGPGKHAKQRLPKITTFGTSSLKSDSCPFRHSVLRFEECDALHLHHEVVNVPCRLTGPRVEGAELVFAHEGGLVSVVEKTGGPDF